MTLPPVIRVFFAIDLPEATKKEVGKFISQLKKQSKSHAIRWTKPENLHITLQFLAEVKTEHLPMLIERVRGKMHGRHQPVQLALGAVHLFPNPYRPRVIVLDVMPQDQLALLSSLIGQGIVDARYAIEERPFRGHLTIGRIKQPQGVDLNFLSSSSSMQDLEKVEINEVVLFRSEPQPEGSKYTVLEKMSL